MRRTQLVLPYPPSANRYWRTALVRGRPQTYVSEEGKAYREEVRQLCAVAGVSCFSGGTSLRLSIFRPRRRGDASNRIKVLEDALRALVYEDDEQNVEVWARRFDDPDDPRVEVTVLNGVTFASPPRLVMPAAYAAQLAAARTRLANLHQRVNKRDEALRARKGAGSGSGPSGEGRKQEPKVWQRPPPPKDLRALAKPNVVRHR